MKTVKQITKQMLLDNNYEVVNSQIISHRGKEPTVLKPKLRNNPAKHGIDYQYAQVRLTLYGKKYDYQYHRVVYAWYHGETPVDLEIDHVDGNSLNNDISNLEVVTAAENTRRRIALKYKKESETLLVQGEVINSTLLLKTGEVVNDILVY